MPPSPPPTASPCNAGARRSAFVSSMRRRSIGRPSRPPRPKSLTELENARLRAAITLQLVEVRESRARIVEAQLAERHRIERDLHDGAQQRLLGLAMQLRAVEMSGDPERMRADGRRRRSMNCKRRCGSCANWRTACARPALTDGGLAAALDDLAARSPVPVRLEATGERFAPASRRRPGSSPARRSRTRSSTPRRARSRSAPAARTTGCGW